jgi:uncharacterized protein (TIGR01777 family)
MRILISGATGFIGTPLCARLKAAGHETVRLTRQHPAPGDTTVVHWHPLSGIIDAASLEGFDAIIHLAGESIASGRWTAAKKELLRESRVKGTHTLCAALEKLKQPPRALASASAIGYYGTRGSELLTEESPAGTGFLPELCRDWEQATAPAADRGVRVVNMRIGVVLGAGGGALAKMLLPFKLGGGGIIGDGQQYWSWIVLDDLVAAMEHIINTETLRGPVNLVAPNPVTNYAFTKTLGKVLHRPTLLPMPAFAARLALGEMADGLLLASARVAPRRLQDTGFTFQHPALEEALRGLLGRPAAVTA